MNTKHCEALFLSLCTTELLASTFLQLFSIPNSRNWNSCNGLTYFLERFRTFVTLILSQEWPQRNKNCVPVKLGLPMQGLPVRLGPEHLNFLYELVVKSMDPNPDTQKPSEAMLLQYCCIPGYSSALLVCTADYHSQCSLEVGVDEGNHTRTQIDEFDPYEELCARQVEKVTIQPKVRIHTTSQHIHFKTDHGTVTQIQTYSPQRMYWGHREAVHQRVCLFPDRRGTAPDQCLPGSLLLD